MLDEGHIVFTGTLDDFDNYILPDSIIVSMLEERGAEELRKIDGGVSVESKGENRYRVNVTDVEAMLETIVDESSRRGWRLREIFPEKNSLDTIFAELSKKPTKDFTI
jgi:ABC-2 type transport system ATP-binding protein